MLKYYLVAFSEAKIIVKLQKKQSEAMLDFEVLNSLFQKYMLIKLQNCYFEKYFNLKNFAY